MNFLPLFYKDAYKIGHAFQYNEGTQEIYSNLTPRTSRIPEINEVVTYGVQYLRDEYLVRQFNDNFFKKSKVEVLLDYKETVEGMLGPDAITYDHIAALHDLGYLPIVIKALPEGSVSPLRVPVLTIKNTLPEFFWLTNALETLISAVLWHPMTTATIARQYRKVLDKYAAETSDMPDFVSWQGHDFSMRGQTSIETATVSGSGHVTSFLGSDTIPVIPFLKKYYGATGLIAGSVAASEHSTMTVMGKEGEFDQFKRLITKVYPKGIVSLVSDGYDYWKVLTETIPSLKAEIMARDGKVVIRPDSGDPVEIICGDKCHITSKEWTKRDNAIFIGTVEHLWNIFGGTVNSKGYKQLDSHIGVIYGDSITLDRAKQICEGLKAKGFASTNIVFGIGSFTYQFQTRDTFGFAMKATHGIVNGAPIDIFKDPVTDNGVKKSAKGLLRVEKVCLTPESTSPHDQYSYVLKEQCTPEEEAGGALQVVFKDGEVFNTTTLMEIRKRLAESV